MIVLETMIYYMHVQQFYLLVEGEDVRNYGRNPIFARI